MNELEKIEETLKEEMDEIGKYTGTKRANCYLQLAQLLRRYSNLCSTSARGAAERKKEEDFFAHVIFPTYDKTCRAMREGIYLKDNWAGDLPGMAPEGKCYFDHSEDCNDKCEFWEGDENQK